MSGAYEVQVGRDGWLMIRASAEALAALAAHLCAWDGDLGAAIADGLAVEPGSSGSSTSAAARGARARRVAYSALQGRYQDEFEGLYAAIMERDNGPCRPGPVVGVTSYKAARRPGEVDANNKRNRCRSRAWTILARAHAAEFRVLYEAALAADDGPVAPYGRRRRTA